MSKGRKKQNLVGEKLGKLTVVEEQGKDKLVVKCDCGNVKTITRQAFFTIRNLRGGCSCGCVRRQKMKETQERLKELDKKYGTKVSKLKDYTKPTKRSTTGVRGVFDLKNGKYQATIGFGGKFIRLGNFDSIEEAAEARRDAEEMYYLPIVEELRRTGEYAC